MSPLWGPEETRRKLESQAKQLAQGEEILRRGRRILGQDLIPKQCHAVIKPLGDLRPHRCPAWAVPNEIYCPIHMVLEGRIKERARRHREGLRYTSGRR